MQATTFQAGKWLIILALLGGCATAPAPKSPPPPPPGPERAEALLQALSALGIDYRYGGRSRETGFDCSGLVAHVYREALGITLPATAEGQAQVGAPVRSADLEAGDLVFYNTLGRRYSHVGIYLGDGRFVHAPRAGAQVRVEQMSNSYWSRRYNGA